MKQEVKDIQNIIDYFKKEGVEGIILYGGLSRDDHMPDSDIDIGIICASQKVINSFRKKVKFMYSHNGHKPEFRYYDIKKLSKEKLPKNYLTVEERPVFWTESNRFNFKMGKILYDPHKKLRKLITEKTKLPKEERKYNEWLLTYEIETILTYDVPRLIKVERFEEAQILMNQSIEKIIHLIYSKHNLLTPHFKSIYFWFRKGKVNKKFNPKRLFKLSEPTKNTCNKRRLLILNFCIKLNLGVRNLTVKEFCSEFGQDKWDLS